MHSNPIRGSASEQSVAAHLPTPQEHHCAAGAARRTALLALAALVALAASGGCGGDEGGGMLSQGDAVADTAAGGEDGTSSARQEKAIKVDAGAVYRGDLVIPIFADGTVRTTRSIDVRTKLGGELVEVHVQDGDRVRTGQLLARIDPRPYEVELEENRYRHIQALSRVAADDDSFAVNLEALASFTQRRDALDAARRRGTLTAEEYQVRTLELELEALKAGAFRQELFEQRTGLAEARTARDRAELDLESTQIRAPFAGVVSGVAVVRGEIVANGATVCSIYDNSRLEASMGVLEADLGDLEVGRPALLAIPATGDTIAAAVDVISPSLDQASRTCEVLVRFDNPDGRYRPGMFVRAEIAGRIHHDRLMVPRAAVLRRDDRPLVFKVQGDRAQWLYVTTGLTNNDWVEILAVHSGGSLAPGDRVVVSDHLTLAHEAKIQIRRDLPPADRWGFASSLVEPHR
jgi:RND family efflux transporter MFP subunit